MEPHREVEREERDTVEGGTGEEGEGDGEGDEKELEAAEREWQIRGAKCT